MALLEGADLVLELPAALATASAELFARGGVQLLDGLGVVNTLCFGSEWGDAKLLMELAHFLAEEPLPFRKALQENLKEGMTFPKARALALCGLFPDNEELSQDTGLSQQYPWHRILQSSDTGTQPDHTFCPERRKQLS